MKAPEYGALVRAAARLYRKAGHYPYHFARGKLGLDPIFPALLSRGLIPDGARVLDLGCGQGCLEAILIAAGKQFEAGIWPEDWPAPPRNITLHGIELQKRTSDWARAALGSQATILTGNMHDVTLPYADVVVVLDVLHHMDRPTQGRVLVRIVRALRGKGLLLLRVSDAAAGLRFQVTRFADKVSSLLRGQGLPLQHDRPATEWKELLETAGFQVASDPMSAGTPFATVLLTARLAPSPR